MMIVTVKSVSSSTKLWVILGLLFLFGTVVSSYEFGVRDYNRRHCGQRLAETLAVICKNGYNVMVSKRSDEDYAYADQSQELAEIQIPGFPMLKQRAGPAMVRLRRGIIEECCYTQCSFKELSEYCKP